MADYRSTTYVPVTLPEVFAYLSDVTRLPEYLHRMREAHTTDPGAVHTTATLADGSTVEGDASWRVDDARKRIQWGSLDDDGYRGELKVHETADTTKVVLHLHTPHGHDDDVQRGADEALEQVRLALTHDVSSI